MTLTLHLFFLVCILFKFQFLICIYIKIVNVWVHICKHLLMFEFYFTWNYNVNCGPFRGRYSLRSSHYASCRSLTTPLSRSPLSRHQVEHSRPVVCMITSARIHTVSPEATIRIKKSFIHRGSVSWDWPWPVSCVLRFAACPSHGFA